MTGGAGMLGHDVARVAGDSGHEVTALARADLDVTDEAALRAAVAEHGPEAIVNCAAWTDVDGAEDDYDGARAVNGTGAGIVAGAAAAAGAIVVYPSTDYVFDGAKREGYVESDPTAPLSAYGRSKLEGEIATAAANPRHCVVRSSWLFGTHGRNFAATMLGLASEHDEVVVVRDQVGCPTFTGHLAEGLVRLLDMDAFGTHHMAGAGYCSWYEFAVEIFRQAEMECRVMSTTTDMLDRRAPRPACSVLLSEREHPVVLPPWQDGLAAFLAEREQVAP